MTDETTQIPLKKSTRQRLRNISVKGETYDELINKLITTREKFESEQGFRRWFDNNFEIFGFDNIVESRSTGFPDYTMLKNGEEVDVELETLSSNFITHGHDPEQVDLVICLVEDEKLPVKALEITSFEFEKRKPLKTPEETGFKTFHLMLELAKRGAHEGACEATSEELAERIGGSQQTIDRWLAELSEAGFIRRKVNPRGQIVSLTAEGTQFLYSTWLDLEKVCGSPPESLKITGYVISGLGEGSYYMNQEKYKKQFKKKLGFNPYPGTLDLKLNEKSLRFKKRLQSSQGEEIEGFSTPERSFGGAKCFPAEVRGAEAGIVLPDRAIHEENVVEIIAPVKLRDKFDLENDDEVNVEVKI